MKNDTNSSALHFELDILNEAVKALSIVLDASHPLADDLSADEIKGRFAAQEAIEAVSDALNHRADGVYQEALEASEPHGSMNVYGFNFGR